MIELNVIATDTNGQPIAGAIVECVVLDTNLAPCPFEPKIKQQPNFYAGTVSFEDAMPKLPSGRSAHPGPYFVYGTAQAAGMNAGYFPKDGGFGILWDGNTTLNITVPLSSFKKPFKAAPRFWKANMCGVRIPGLPAVPGGAVGDPSLFLSWFYHLYDDATRAHIRSIYGAKYTHWLLSWPDARAAGVSPDQFKSHCQELITDGFYPCVMLSSKDFDPPDVAQIINGVTPLVGMLVGTVPIFCIGWELSLWLTPTQVQQLTDGLAPAILMEQPGTLVYVHFQQGYPSFQQEGGTVADYWVQQVGKLTGLLYQKIIEQNDAQFLDSINDCLQRFSGGFNMPTGFDFVALELSAMTQYAGTCSEAEGDRIGRLAINAPKVNGVGVMGSGNGS